MLNEKQTRHLTLPLWKAPIKHGDEQKRAEQQLKASDESFRVLAETVPQLVWTTQPDGLHDYTNQHWRDYTGFTPEHIQRWDHLQFIHPDDRAGNQALWRHALDTGELFECEGRLRNGQNGEYRWFLTRAMPVRDDTGQIVKWFGTCTDVEKQKRAEQQLKESRESLHVLAETVPQLVWVVGSDGQHEYMNRRCCDYLGFTAEHMQSDPWAHLQSIHPADRAGNQALWQHALDKGTMYEHEERLRNGQNGEYRWFLTRAMPMRDEGGHIVKWFGTCTDIEEQKRTEEALRQSQERANALMNSNIIGINVIEGEQMVDANDTFLRMTGYTREDLRAGHMNVTHLTAPEDLARTRQAHQELATQRVLTPYEKEYLCQDGSRLPVLVGGILLQHHPSQAIGFALDNSARKELEQRKDAFISMASHELKTPLTAVKLQTQLVRKRLEKHSQHEAATALARVEVPVKQLERLITELLDVSRMQAGSLEYRRERVDLDELLREVTATIYHLHPSHTILVRGSMQTSLIGDRDRLGQVFTNLLSNAIKYSPDAEAVEIDLSPSEDLVTVHVRDHGLGIPREQLDKIFERFYRVTDLRQRAIPGLGMGLYIVAEIVKQHGGTITVDSAVGKGSTFTVTLPREPVEK
ncbi:MAG TPA: PAS domain-containing sensor histidine kinase [Ktedonobacteraceae bacterium]